jgi:hypothetical protein
LEAQVFVEKPGRMDGFTLEAFKIWRILQEKTRYYAADFT